ncbi:MAG: hypothetical protein J7M40_06150 [Planctomycetes bacterium]|nr:hypothetical protein [Planctomycetota bacterium]
MLKYLQNKPVISIIAACIVICAAMIRPANAQFGGASGVLAPTRIQQGDYGRDRSQGRQPVNRQQQAKQAIQTAAREMDQTLVQILEMVNKQARPRPEMLDASKRTAAIAGKYGKQYSAGLRCEILMLRAWNGYYADDMPTAVMAARQAYQTDSTNRDAEATHVTMSLLMDRKPQKIAPRKSPTTSSNNSRSGRRNSRSDPYTATQNARDAAINVKASTGNILNLNIDAIDLDLIGQTVPPMQVNCLNSTTFDYNPAQSTLCLLFWQLGSRNASGEPNNMMPGMATGRAGYGGGGAGYGGGGRASYGGGRAGYGGGYAGGGAGYGGRGGGYDERGYGGRGDYRDEGDYGAGYRQPDTNRTARKGDPFASEMTAYGQIFGSYLAHPKVKFLAVNTDPITSAPTVVNKLLKSPWPWAQVMAAKPASGMAQYANLDCKQPKLAIVDTSGTIKYAGPAAGFLAPMMLTRLAGAPPSTTPTRPPGGRTPPRMMINPFKGLFGGNTPRPPARPPANTQTDRTTTPPPPNRTNEDDNEITPESYQAGKLLEYAKMFVSAGRKPVLTSKKGIDLCRQIIHDYPNTKYEREARLLLRRVPEYERKRYKITDKEMGL